MRNKNLFYFSRFDNDIESIGSAIFLSIMLSLFIFVESQLHPNMLPVERSWKNKFWNKSNVHRFRVNMHYTNKGVDFPGCNLRSLCSGASGATPTMWSSTGRLSVAQRGSAWQPCLSRRNGKGMVAFISSVIVVAAMKGTGNVQRTVTKMWTLTIYLHTLHLSRMNMNIFAQVITFYTYFHIMTYLWMYDSKGSNWCGHYS